jgi:uracil-DNA glycosylase family 4
MDVRNAADVSAKLALLADGIRHCERCRLHEGRRHAVPGEGPADAEMVFLGEGPGGREDLTGRPFVGPAGRFLDALLKERGIDRSRVFITNCVKCRPPENRTPRRDELKICTATWLHPQLELLRPRRVVLLGQVAARQMLGEKATISALHGTALSQGGQTYFVTYHPSAALRFDAVADAIRADFEKLSPEEGIVKGG